MIARPKSMWSYESLDQLCEIVIGRTPSRSEPKYWGEGSYWLSIADMGKGRDINMTKETITKAGADICGKRLIIPGTVVFSFKLSIGKVGIVRTPMYTNEAIAALLIKDTSVLDSNYLYYVMCSLDLTDGSDRAAMGLTLNKKKLSEISIPLPPVEEQKRIAAILDKADAIRRKRKEAIALTEELLRSTFLDMFGDPLTNPKGWEKVKIKDLVFPIKNWNPIKSPLNNLFVYIDIASINRETKRIEKATNIWTHEAPSRARQLGKTGDVLVSTVRPNLNAVAYLNKEYDGATISTGFTVLRPDNNKLNSHYLHSWVKTKHFIDNMIEKSTGASYPAVTDIVVKASEILLPPIEKQKLFACFEEKIQLSINKMQQIEVETDNLFNSLLQKAFRGEL